MANEQNLIYGDKLSQSKARENGRKGGKKSGESKREKKKFKEIMQELLYMPMDELEGECPAVAICKKQILNAAQNGDTQSASWCRDTADEKPVDRRETNVNVNSLDKEQRDAAVQAALLGMTE